MQLPLFLKIGQKLRHNWIFKTAKAWCKGITSDSAPAEYRQWRHRFIIKRLYLMTWVAIFVIAIGHITDWILPFTSLNLSNPRYNFFYLQNSRVFLAIRIIVWIEILFTFALLKISLVREYPIYIQLWITWTLLISPQVILIIFLGIISVDGYGWIVVLSAGPILMPVKWQWHCLCQMFFLAYLAISSFVFDFYDPFIEEIEYFDAVYITVIVCFIVNYAVFLYERFLQQEFELRRQLRLFLHTVSHDLRNPLLGTMFLLKSLRNPSAEETIVKNEILDQIIDSSDRQLQLINSLLEAYNTETKGIIVRPRPVRLDNLVRSVITEMQPLLEKERAIAIAKVSTTLPLVNIDPLQIRRVYENLIVNALEHNKSGLRLIFEAKKDFISPHSRKKTNLDRLIYCMVSDNGEGITPQQSSRLFDLYTGASTTKQSLNTGLGLYICRQIINAHGGKIGVNNTSQGASFWFTLPIAKT